MPYPVGDENEKYSNVDDITDLFSQAYKEDKQDVNDSPW